MKSDKKQKKVTRYIHQSSPYNTRYPRPYKVSIDDLIDNLVKSFDQTYVSYDYDGDSHIFNHDTICRILFHMGKMTVNYSNLINKQSDWNTEGLSEKAAGVDKKLMCCLPTYIAQYIKQSKNSDFNLSKRIPDMITSIILSGDLDRVRYMVCWAIYSIKPIADIALGDMTHEHMSYFKRLGSIYFSKCTVDVVVDVYHKFDIRKLMLDFTVDYIHKSKIHL